MDISLTIKNISGNNLSMALHFYILIGDKSCGINELYQIGYD